MYSVPEGAVQAIVEAQLFVYVAMVVLNYLHEKHINILQIWIVAFVFIIHSEMLILADARDVFEYLSPFFLFLMSNNLVILGYHLSKRRVKPMYSIVNYQVYNKPLFALLVVVFMAVFIYGSIQNVRDNLLLGRQLDDTVGSAKLGAMFVDSIGIMLPSLIAFLFKDVKGKIKWLQLIFVIPIFLIHIILATRFKLLFSFIPFCVVSGMIDVVRVSWQRLVALLAIAIGVSMLSSFMKENRYLSITELTYDNYVIDEYEGSKWSVKLGAQMSPEGVLQMAKYADDYFSNHDLTYGKECANLLYRWVPRKLWRDKPKPIDHWLIRYYEDVSDAHSSSSGFIGVFRADFGWFALFFALLLGFLLKRLDIYTLETCMYKKDSLEIIMASLMFSYVFFMVRSPITATYILLYEYIVYVVIRKLTTNKVYIANK
jgi:hypothetical protein